jgi:hypothetical protein
MGTVKTPGMNSNRTNTVPRGIRLVAILEGARPFLFLRPGLGYCGSCIATSLRWLRA